MLYKNTISQKVYNKTIELLSDDKIFDVLELLTEHGIDVIQLKAKYSRDKKENRANRLSHSDYSVSRSRISQTIQELVSDLIIEEKPIPSKDAEKEQSNTTLKNVINHSKISPEGDVHIGDKITHNHIYLDKPKEPEPPKKTNDSSYVNKISDSFIFKLEKLLIMSSEYQYSFSNPEYRILSHIYLEDLISKLKTSEEQLDALDIELFSYKRTILDILKHEVKNIRNLKSILEKSNLKDSHLYSLSTTVLSYFNETIDQIEGNEMDADDGTFLLDEKRQNLTDELVRIKKTASKFSLN